MSPTSPRNLYKLELNIIKMPKKSKKRVARAPRKVVAAKSADKSASVGTYGKRVSLVLKNLVLFLVLFVLTVILGSLFKGEILDDVFWILAILTGFISAALLIVLLVLLFIKAIKN